MTTSTITPEIVEFARGVRAALADLPAEEVEDLTDGLEADLAESYAEDLRRELPDPVAYAEELRNAAGLPMREASAKGGIGLAFRGVGDSIGLKRANLAETLRGNPLAAGILDLLVELRPAWWIVRAWVAYQLAGTLFSIERPLLPSDLPSWVLLGLFVLVSVQWGRRKWLPFGPMGVVILAGNLLATLWLIPAVANANDSARNTIQTQYVTGGGPDPTGVVLNGKPVTNIFAYGADGKPLTNVQLFDENGRPLATSVPGGNGCLEKTPCVEGNGEEGQGVWVATVLETGAKAWNVFPMLMQGAKYDDMTGELVADPLLKPEVRTSPFIKVPAILTPPKSTGKVDKGNG